MQSADSWQTMQKHTMINSLAVKQAPTPGSVTKTTSTGFFQRMSDALATVVIGWVLIVFSVPVIWFNERRDARMSALRGYAQSDIRTADADKADRDNRNCLVHIQGAQMTSAEPVQDSVFDVELTRDCLRLQHQCEVFQVIQHEQQEEREKLGGGKETITTYTYSEEWSDTWHDSSSYENAFYRRNTKPPGLEVGKSSYSCQRVEFGQGFLLGTLVDQCDAFCSAEHRLSQSINLRKSNTCFRRDGTGMFYYNQHGSTPQRPQIGDARVCFEYVPDGPGTVLALQVESQKDERDTFLPYRLVSHGICGINESDLKLALREEARKTPEDLAAEEGCPGALACICCACHLTAKCFAAFFTAQIYSVFHGDLGAQQCFTRIKNMQSLQTLVLRLVGWLMMFAGLYMTFSPVLTLITAFPFIGPFVAKLGGWILWVLCLVVTIIAACIIASVAYLVYRPLVALVYMIVAALVVAAFFVISQALKG